jgi:hypothetical protein
MVLKSFFRFILTILIISLIGLGIYDYLSGFDENECSMTYMKQNPGIIPVDLPLQIKSQFPNYKLYYYCEGYDCQKYEKLKFNEPNQIPVLFIPGNADSHMQVRSMASIGLDKSRKHKYAKKNIKFHYFTISFNEELTALYGPLLEIQTNYVKICIKHILKLFGSVQPEFKRPKSVVLIGNSMGGIIARGIFTSAADSHLVHTIITKSSPHNRPVINVDKHLSNYYDRVNSLWLNKSENRLKNVVLASLYGGTRDILVRSGLANLNDWKSKSPAGIISSYTVSMPHVWRNIDHRCMAWCRELVMNLNRALFSLIDSETGQIIENRNQRENILRFHLERDILKNSENILSLNNPELVSNKHFEFNDYSQTEKSYIFDLNQIVGSHLNDTYDSLFIYTNINTKNSFLLCKELNENMNECMGEIKDLMSTYGRSLPPYVEGVQKDSSLKTVNIINIDKIKLNENFRYLIVRVAANLKSSHRHQTIVKFDWYMIKKRLYFINLPTLQNMKDSINKYIDSEPAVFKRIYLPTFLSVIQAFDLRKYFRKNSCDLFLIKLNKDSKFVPKPLSVSTLMIQFNEPISNDLSSEHVYHSQSIQTKTKNLTLILTKNSDYEQKNFPYIDLIQFDLKHLIQLNDKLTSEMKKSQDFLSKCSMEHYLELDFNIQAILGQFIRFYILFIPAFLVAILQFYDYIVLRSSSMDENKNISFFFLNGSLTNFWYHFQYSVFINLIIYLTIQFHYANETYKFINMSQELDMIRNDFEQLNNENIWFSFLPFVLYWSAYSILSTACFFLSLIFSLYSFFLHELFFNLFKFLRKQNVQYVLFGLNVIITVVSGYFASTLAYVNIFYANIMRLCTNNPAYQAKTSYRKFTLEQTRLILTYLLLILHLSPMLVWIKSLNSNEIRPLNYISQDNGYYMAVWHLVIHIIYYLKDKIPFLRDNLLYFNNNFLANLIMFNSILTILYASVNMYRLEYFVLVHLSIMIFNSVKNSFKSKNE